MMNWLHAFEPQPILVSWGPLIIHWYGLTMALAILAAVIVAVVLGRAYQVKAETIIDLSFWLIIGGFIGARLYYVGLTWDYYQNNLWDILKIWQGGLAIHGAIIAGLVILWLFVKQRRLNFWLAASLIVPGLALGQAIGRWGNYFNQELFGLPTGLPWGIPIAVVNRPAAYLSNQFFHPTFLYESICSLLIFGFLALAHWLARREKTNQETNYRAITLSYLIFYSVVRFVLEDFRVDETPLLGLWRWPQVVSAIIALASLAILLYSAKRKKKPKTEFI
jgi:phosphatidylglycerol:prolipoprotein diacylglycerol transferase